MVKMRRSVFRGQPRNTFTCKMGYVVPIACYEALPGDSWSFNVADAIRMIPMLAPQYTDVSVSIMAFQVNLHTIWDDYEQFRTGGKNNDDTTEAPYILINADKCNFSSLADYLGVPPLAFHTKNESGAYVANSQVAKVSALPFRAYNKIWNEYLRVEHLQDEIEYSTASGYDTTTPTTLLKRRWNRDYFTNLLPDQQLGPQAYIPVALEAPVRYKKDVTATEDNTISAENGKVGHWGNSSSTPFNLVLNDDEDKYNILTDSKVYPIVTDLTNATAIPWSSVRLTEKMQQVGEKLMLGGARLPEFIYNFFGTTTKDQRIDRAIYLGGFSSDVHISPIMQTSATDATSPQGNQSAVAYHVNGTSRFNCFFEEDGFVMILMSIRPRTSYAQGLHKKFQRWTRFDYANPMFAHLSLEPVKESEIYLQGVENGTSSTDWDDKTLDDNKTFGFKPMYQELRSWPNETHGDMLNTRQYWNMTRIFDTKPELNSDFVSCTPTRRPFALSDEQKADEVGSVGDVCLCETMINLKVKRVLPKVGTPRF